MNGVHRTKLPRGSTVVGREMVAVYVYGTTRSNQVFILSGFGAVELLIFKTASVSFTSEYGACA